MLIVDVETQEYEDPETGETQTRETKYAKRPFEVRISRWIGRDSEYHVYGFVVVTEFGLELASQSNPAMWVNDLYTVSDKLSESMISEMVNGVSAVKNAHLDSILNFGNVAPGSTKVESEQDRRFDFHIVLDGAETFDIDWLIVDFDPSRGGV